GDQRRRPAWMAWRKEIFADIFGSWMAGPAFAWSLADHLAGDQAAITAQSRPRSNGDWTEYPTATLRILLVCEVLKRIGFTSEAGEIRHRWEEAYPQHQLQEFTNDFAEVIDRLGAVVGITAIESHAFLPAMMESVARVVNKYTAGSALLPSDPQP